MVIWAMEGRAMGETEAIGIINWGSHMSAKDTQLTDADRAKNMRALVRSRPTTTRGISSGRLIRCFPLLRLGDLEKPPSPNPLKRGDLSYG